MSQTIYLLGDSTCAEKDPSVWPETGWGMALQAFVRPDWKVKNLALDGRSTKSFLEEGSFSRCLMSLKEGDYVFIQFGHNDSKEDERHTDPFSTFQGNLAFMAEQTISKRAYPILLTPICRRRFSKQGNLVQTHGEYPEAIRSLAQSRAYQWFDMTKATYNLLSRLGPHASKRLFLRVEPEEHPNYPEGVVDDTHLNEEGAKVVASLLVQLLRQSGISFPFLANEKIQ